MAGTGRGYHEGERGTRTRTVQGSIEAFKEVRGVYTIYTGPYKTFSRVL